MKGGHHHRLRLPSVSFCQNEVESKIGEGPRKREGIKGTEYVLIQRKRRGRNGPMKEPYQRGGALHMRLLTKKQKIKQQ